MSGERLTLDAILADPALALELAAPEAVRLLAHGAAVVAVLQARVATAAVGNGSHDGRPEPDAATKPAADGAGWITPDQAAAVVSVSRRVIFGWSRRIDWKPFTRRLNRKRLLIEETGLRRWLERSR